MITQLLWWINNGLLACLLVLGWRSRLFAKYPFFFSYVGFVLAVSLTRYYIHTFDPTAYLEFYWYTQLISVAVGYGVTWEIYSQALDEYPGTIAMARFGVSAVFIGVVVKGIFNTFHETGGLAAARVVELERDFRTVQAVLLIVVLFLIVYYKIPLGRNLQGLLLGYGTFVGFSVITLQLRTYIGPSFQAGWTYLQQSAYVVALIVWALAFRSFSPNPAPEHEVYLERDYELVASRTLHAITKAKGYLLRTPTQ